MSKQVKLRNKLTGEIKDSLDIFETGEYEEIKDEKLLKSIKDDDNE